MLPIQQVRTVENYFRCEENKQNKKNKSSLIIKCFAVKNLIYSKIETGFMRVKKNNIKFNNKISLTLNILLFCDTFWAS